MVKDFKHYLLLKGSFIILTSDEMCNLDWMGLGKTQQCMDNKDAVERVKNRNGESTRKNTATWLKLIFIRVLFTSIATIWTPWSLSVPQLVMVEG